MEGKTRNITKILTDNLYPIQYQFQISIIYLIERNHGIQKSPLMEVIKIL